MPSQVEQVCQTRCDRLKKGRRCNSTFTTCPECFIFFLLFCYWIASRARVKSVKLTRSFTCTSRLTSPSGFAVELMDLSVKTQTPLRKIKHCRRPLLLAAAPCPLNLSQNTEHHPFLTRLHQHMFICSINLYFFYSFWRPVGSQSIERKRSYLKTGQSNKSMTCSRRNTIMGF